MHAPTKQTRAAALVVAAALAVAAAAQLAAAGPPDLTGPCFGQVGYSRRGIDIGYNKDTKKAFSSTHTSFWNYTRGVALERYDVAQCDLDTNDCFGKTHLFHFSSNEAWEWEWSYLEGPANGTKCVKKAQPVTNYECVPSDFKPVGKTMIAGVPCVVWSDINGTHQQVSTADQNDPILVQVIKRDENGNVVEFAQIQDYRRSLPGGPSDLAVPSFCP